MKRRKYQLPELWKLLSDHGYTGKDVPIIAGCAINRAQRCMAGRETFTVEQAQKLATACGEQFSDVAGHFIPVRLRERISYDE